MPLPEGEIIECDNCQARYLIPTEELGDGPLKFKCGKCDHVFEWATSGAAPEVPADDSDDYRLSDLDDNPVTASDDLDSDLPGQASNAGDVGLGNVSIPDENKIAVDDLLGDFDSDEADIDFPDALKDDFDLFEDDFSSKPSANATEEYLKSVDIGGYSEIEGVENDKLRAVSEDQKHKFFLKPENKKKSPTGQSKGIENELSDHRPEIQNETDEIDPEMENVDLPEADSSDMPAFNSANEKSKSSSINRKKVIAGALFVILFLILISVGGFLLLNNHNPVNVPLPLETPGSGKNIRIMEPLNGKYIVNKASGKRIFILQGKLKNLLPSELKISGVKVKGILYDKDDRVIGESTVFAGNNLPRANLENYSQEKTESFFNNQFGENNKNLNLGFNQVIPFQVVFFEISGEIAKLEAQIVGFSKNVQD